MVRISYICFCVGLSLGWVGVDQGRVHGLSVCAREREPGSNSIKFTKTQFYFSSPCFRRGLIASRLFLVYVDCSANGIIELTEEGINN